MENNKRDTANAKELELLDQFGIEKVVQIKLCKLKFYTFKEVAGNKSGNKLEHSTPKLKGLSSTQNNSRSSLKIAKNSKGLQSSYEAKRANSTQRRSFKPLAVKPKPFKCELCEYSARMKADLVRHIRTHTDEKPFKYVLCTRKFVTKCNLVRHIRTHTGEKFYHCQFCKKQFSQSSRKKSHEQICKVNPRQADKKWVENQKKFKCSLCSYSVITKYRLQLHLKTHTDERKFECKLCSSKLKSLLGLQKHIVTHTGEKPFPCQFCRRAFSQKANTNSHEKICKLNPKQNDPNYIELLKKFKCPKCSYCFKTKGNLTTHLRIHTGEKMYACILCTYKGRSKTYLNIHIRTHTKEKPFKCPHCDFASGYPGEVKRHVSARHCDM